MTAKDKPGQTLDQRRAAHAWGVIEALKSPRENEARNALGLSRRVVEGLERLSPADRAHIIRAARKLPVRIVTAGLGHALVFIRAKAKTRDKDQVLLEALSAWVIQFSPARPRTALKSPPVKSVSATVPPEPELLKRIREGTGDDMRHFTAECLAWLAWFNRFAEAEFPDISATADEGGDHGLD